MVKTMKRKRAPGLGDESRKKKRLPNVVSEEEGFKIRKQSRSSCEIYDISVDAINVVPADEPRMPATIDMKALVEDDHGDLPRTRAPNIVSPLELKLLEGSEPSPSETSSSSDLDSNGESIDEEDADSDSDVSHSLGEQDQAMESPGNVSRSEHLEAYHTQAPDLKTRLATFLPQLQKANQELKDAGNAQGKRIDAVSDGEQHYIEMSLGLGVLKEKTALASEEVRIRGSSSSSSDALSVEEGEVDGNSPQCAHEDILVTLLGGRKSLKQKVGIEEVDKK